MILWAGISGQGKRDLRMRWLRTCPRFLGVVDVPVLVVAAEKDQTEVLERVRTEVAERIPQATFEVLPGSGHLSPLDAPREVADQILGFLERNA